MQFLLSFFFFCLIFSASSTFTIKYLIYTVFSFCHRRTGSVWCLAELRPVSFAFPVQTVSPRQFKIWFGDPLPNKPNFPLFMLPPGSNLLNYCRFQVFCHHPRPRPSPSSLFTVDIIKSGLKKLSWMFQYANNYTWNFFSKVCATTIKKDYMVETRVETGSTPLVTISSTQ